MVGRDAYGVFPLRGMLLNVRAHGPEKVAQNAEIQNVCRIVGLNIPPNMLQKEFKPGDRPAEDFKEESIEEVRKKMRYGSITIMTDQDFDGSHIKGLLLNFLSYYWPALVRHEPNFVREFVTPIVKARKGKEVLAFFTIPEYEQWKENLKAAGEDPKSWKIKYYKGLGTSTSKEAKQYFQDLERHSLTFKYTGEGAKPDDVLQMAVDDDKISMAFDKGREDDRKQWILDMDEEAFVDHNEMEISIPDFINKELVGRLGGEGRDSSASCGRGLCGIFEVWWPCFDR